MRRFKVVNGKAVTLPGRGWTDPAIPKTYWNFEHTPAVIVRVIVGKSDAPLAWSKGLEGTEREAVKVTYGSQVFYLDNDAFEDGEGHYRAGAAWDKVTLGLGSPRYGHRSLAVEREVTS